MQYSFETQQLTFGQISLRDGIEVAVEQDLSEDTPLTSGQFLPHQFCNSLHLHGGDIIEEQAFDIRSSISPGLSCIFFLEGSGETRIGGRTFDFPAAADKPIHAVMVMNIDITGFRRRSLHRQRIRPLVIKATPDWLVQHEQPVDRHSGGFFTRNLSENRWSVPQDVL